MRERIAELEAELAESDKVLRKTLWSMRCILSEYEHEIDDLTLDMATATIIFKAEEHRADILKAEQDKLQIEVKALREVNAERIQEETVPIPEMDK